ncbi:MAG: response regulator [Bacteroidia bacterium]|nr:response regulator [Bacteroidia bacterium]
MHKFDLLVFIDDDRPNNVFHELIMEESGLGKEAKSFLSPLKALAYFQELEDQNEIFPEIIFLDINMPQMTGWEFLDRFEEMELKKYPWIVILSSSNYHKDKALSDAHPLVHSYIEKPLSKENLQALLIAFQDAKK